MQKMCCLKIPAIGKNGKEIKKGQVGFFFFLLCT